MSRTFRKANYRSFRKSRDSWRGDRRPRAVPLNQRAEAQALVGRRVRWAHLPEGEPVLVLRATSEGMVEIAGFVGEFSPSGFVPVEEPMADERRALSLEDRVAIAELVKAAELLGESHLAHPNAQVQALGAILLQRAARIADGRAHRYEYDQSDVDEFVALVNRRAD